MSSTKRRAVLYTQFVDQFAVSGLDGPHPCTSTQIDQAEEALDTYLPVAYREFLSTCGPLFVPELSDPISHSEMGVELVREFFEPEDMVCDTRLYWSGGMPPDFIGIASDGGGNMFGFQRSMRNMPRPDDLPVLFFDHDFVRVVQLKDSFEEWLRWFVEQVPARPPRAILAAARECWQRGEPLEAGRLIFENLPQQVRPRWAAGILGVVLWKSELDPSLFREILEIADNPSQWGNANRAFFRLRDATTEIDKNLKSGPTPEQELLGAILSLTELVAKVIYNATNPQDNFDEDSGSRIVVRFKSFVDDWRDEEFSKAAWSHLSLNWG